MGPVCYIIGSVLSGFGRRLIWSGNSATLLHPQVTALKEEYRPDNNTSSSSSSDDNAPPSPFLPLMQTWTYWTCNQPLLGVMHITCRKNPRNGFTGFETGCIPVLLKLIAMKFISLEKHSKLKTFILVKAKDSIIN